ncbi:hypothetical protein HZB88_05485 [archaeon]|nr:hypothetical protein [archaeon]
MKEKENATIHVKIEEPSELRKEVLNSAVLVAEQKKKYEQFKKTRIEKEKPFAELRKAMNEIKVLAGEIKLSELPEQPAKETRLPRAPEKEAYKEKEEFEIDEEIDELKRKIEQL